MRAMTEPLLRVESLVTEFRTRRGSFRAVDGVSLEVAPRQVLAILGESGSGKTMTAFSILRIVPPPGQVTGGHLWYRGRDLLALSARAMRELRGKRLAMIFQNPRDRVDPVQTIGRQLSEILLLHGACEGRREARVRALALLDEVRVASPARVLSLYPHELSGGMLQRVMIAMALSASPEVLIADEPTTALDVTIQSEILDLLTALKEQRGMSMVFITHDIKVAQEVADVVAVMYAGHVVEYGAAKDVLWNPLHPYTQALLACVPGGVEHEGRLTPIPGQPVSLLALPRGCRFAPRCPHAHERCERAVPPLEPASGRLVRCVLYQDEQNAGQGRERALGIVGKEGA